MTLPVRVVLVETHGLQNLGAVARLLDKFEVQDWVLVRSKCSPSDPEALAYATGISAPQAVRVIPCRRPLKATEKPFLSTYANSCVYLSWT